MRILHTADWHLGRIFYGIHLTDDQAHMLDHFYAIVKETRPSVIVISGDIYDRAVPPPEAVKLLDQTIKRLLMDFKIPMLIIAGNHDSPERLGFGAQLMETEGLYIRGMIGERISPVVINDEHGPVYFYPVPYFEPVRLREIDSTIALGDHATAMNIIMQQISALHDPAIRSVICAHAFVNGGELTESERPLSVGGSGIVDTSAFDKFSYTALGHLHRCQTPSPRVHYSGSPMAYSFSESTHKKSVTLVHLNEKSEINLEFIPITTRRNVRCIKGTIQELLNMIFTGVNQNDYICAELLDLDPVLDAIGKLRVRFPNILHIERPLRLINSTESDNSHHKTMTDIQLFETFYNQVTGNPLNEKQLQTFKSVLDKLRLMDREDVP